MRSWRHGAYLSDDGNSATFRVWAPLAKQVSLILPERGSEKVFLEKGEFGYWWTSVADCKAGTRYMYQVDDNEPRPDPASRHQPDGVHAPSAVVEHRYKWKNSEKWMGLPLEDYVIYEFHVGTFTEEGTFDAAIRELPRLKELGITAVEIMPVAQFPGDRNWGYDGVFPYATQDSYGGLAGLQRFVDAAHELSLAVVLDVVYNHLGPEGNYLTNFGPYFTHEHQTPWGPAINYDSQYSDGVRDFFVGNALFFMECCHVDALRLDAVHAIIDTSAYPFLRQLTKEVHALGRQLHKRLHVMGENDRNDPKFAMSPEVGGIGADTQWSDDFHHALHAVLTGENYAYYKDFGKVSQLAKAYTDGFVYDGCYSESRLRHHGADSRHLEGVRFIACAQNHDQIGNRPKGERLSMILDFPRIKLGAMALLTAPYIPLIFMGEESACESPFLYFVSHSDKDLIEAVRQGRAQEFREFFSTGTAPDPQEEATFLASKLRHNTSPEGLAVTRLYTDLLRLRKEIQALRPVNKRLTFSTSNDMQQTLILRRESEGSAALCLFNFSEKDQGIIIPAEAGTWQVLLQTESADYLGGMESNGKEIGSNGEIRLLMQKSSGVILHHNRVPQFSPTT